MFEWRQPHTAGGARAKKTSAAESTVYVDELYERRKPSDGNGSHVFHIYAGGREVAQVTRSAVTGNETVRYLHRDQLGSVSLVTSEEGDVMSREDFSPFGERINADGSRKEAEMSGVSWGYTGHEHDDELGLINMRGRVYDPMARKFLTPDPIVSDVMVGGSWNPYSYVQNNPVRFVDPSGYQSENPWGPCGNSICDVLSAEYEVSPPGGGDSGNSSSKDAPQTASEKDAGWSAALKARTAKLNAERAGEHIGMSVGSSDSEGDSSPVVTTAGVVGGFLLGLAQGVTPLGAELDSALNTDRQNPTAQLIAHGLGQMIGGMVGVVGALITGGAGGLEAAVASPTVVGSAPGVALAAASAVWAAGAATNVASGWNNVWKAVGQGADAPHGGRPSSGGGPPGRGRAPEFPSGQLREADFPDAALKYLKPGYKEVSPGRYLSEDGLRQVRYGVHETGSATHHAHFEAYDRRGGRVIENAMVELVP